MPTFGFHLLINDMNKKHLFTGLCALLLLVGCGDNSHFISAAAYRAEAAKDLQAQQVALPNGDLFEGFDLPLCLHADRRLDRLQRGVLFA